MQPVRADYEAYLRTTKWRAKRERVLGRCDGWCERCGAQPAEHIHHLTYERFGNEHLDDLQALCVVCHGKIHPHRTFVSKLPARERRLAQRNQRLGLAHSFQPLPDDLWREQNQQYADKLERKLAAANEPPPRGKQPKQKTRNRNPTRDRQHPGSRCECGPCLAKRHAKNRKLRDGNKPLLG